jgi:hypothetical protein
METWGEADAEEFEKRTKEHTEVLDERRRQLNEWDSKTLEARIINPWRRNEVRKARPYLKALQQRKFDPLSYVIGALSANILQVNGFLRSSSLHPPSPLLPSLLQHALIIIIRPYCGRPEYIG